MHTRVTLTLTSLAMISAPPIKIICSLTEVKLPCTSLSGSPCPSCGASFGHNKKALRRGDAIIPQLSLPVKGFLNIFDILYNLSVKWGLVQAWIGRITKKWPHYGSDISKSQKGKAKLPSLVYRSPPFFLPYSEHPPQKRRQQGRGAQDHDLHLDTLLSVNVGIGIVIICNSDYFGSGGEKSDLRICFVHYTIFF